MRSYDAQEFIAHLANVSEAVGLQAGVGGMETAGGIVSYLYDECGRVTLCNPNP